MNGLDCPPITVTRYESPSLLSRKQSTDAAKRHRILMLTLNIFRQVCVKADLFAPDEALICIGTTVSLFKIRSRLYYYYPFSKTPFILRRHDRGLGAVL